MDLKHSVIKGLSWTGNVLVIYRRATHAGTLSPPCIAQKWLIFCFLLNIKWLGGQETILQGATCIFFRLSQVKKLFVSDFPTDSLIIWSTQKF